MKRFNTYEEFIVENDNLKLLTKEQLSWCKKHIKGTFSVNNQGEVIVPKDLSFKNSIFGRFPVKFGTVKGNFECVNCENLVSLEGSPSYVRGNFLIGGCPSLESLDGAPTYVRQNFEVNDDEAYRILSKFLYNKAIRKPSRTPEEIDTALNHPKSKATTLDGIPKDLYVEGYFIIKSNSLVSLEIVPKTITVEAGYAYTSENLVSLKGAPSHVEGSFECNYCPKLVSLKGAPAHVGGDFNCYYCVKLASLEGAPAHVGGNFDCRSCSNLVSLEGAPAHVGGNFDCRSCSNLVSLEGAPSQVGKKFNLMYRGCPKLPDSFTGIIDDYFKKEIDWKTAHKMIHSEPHRAARSLGIL